VLQSAYAAVASSEVAIIATLNLQIDRLGSGWASIFGRPRHADICASVPSLGMILGVRILGKFGDARTATPTPRSKRTTSAPHRSPRPPAPRRSSWPATHATAASATQSSSARSAQSADHPAPPPNTSSSSKIGHQAALRQLANRLVGILHGCLKNGAPHNERTAWVHIHNTAA
jgi:hypothetical protein